MKVAGEGVVELLGGTLWQLLERELCKVKGKRETSSSSSSFHIKSIKIYSCVISTRKQHN